uniref:Ig-like domain-containing protein n=1 Tax=Callorhinchus milii TaxID=7868 RepID=A0A4W3GCV6_CALMI
IWELLTRTSGKKETENSFLFSNSPIGSLTFNLRQKGSQTWNVIWLFPSWFPAVPSPPSVYFLLPTCGQSPSSGSVTLGCLATEYNSEPATLTWTSDKGLITDQVKTYPSVFNKNSLYTLSSELTIAVSQLENDNIHCKVEQKSNNWPPVAIPVPGQYHVFQKPLPPIVILTQSSPEDITMHKPATAVCSIFGFHPDKLSVKWLKDWQPITSGAVTSPSVKEDNGTFSTSSRLTVPAIEWGSGAVYTCQVSHGPTQTIIVKNITKSSDVKVYFLPPSQEQVLMECYVTLTCVVANAPLHVNVTWTQGKTHLQSGYGKPSANDPQEVISKLNISTQDWNDGKEFFCIASHDDMPTPIREKTFKRTGESVGRFQSTPVFPVTPTLSVTLTCLVKDFTPKEIFVQWTVNDQVIDATNYKSTEVMADSAHHHYSMYSMLSISAGEWDRGSSYSCVVGHEAFPLKTLTRTVNKSSGKPSFVNISLVLMDTVNACQ